MQMLVSNPALSERDITALKRVKNPSSAIWKITPELAKLILDKYHDKDDNRNASTSSISLLTKDLVEGRWQLTGDTIKFDTRGRLRDGQHRLRACLRSGVSITTCVTAGIDPHTFDVMDVGRGRNAADIFKLAGIAYAQQTAGATQWLARLSSPGPFTDRASRTPSDLLRLYREEANTLDVFYPLAEGAAKRLGVGSSVPMMMALAFLMSSKDADKCNTFFTEIANAPRPLPKGDNRPVVSLLREFERRQELMRQTGGRMRDTDSALLVALAWNAYVQNRTLPLTGDRGMEKLTSARTLGSVGEPWPGLEPRPFEGFAPCRVKLTAKADTDTDTDTDTVEV